jgi:hypothetical protein
VEEEVEEHTDVDGIAEQVLRRPDVLAALQGRLHAEMLEVNCLASIEENKTIVKSIKLLS